MSAIRISHSLSSPLLSSPHAVASDVYGITHLDARCYQIVSLSLSCDVLILSSVIRGAPTGRGLANPGKEGDTNSVHMCLILCNLTTFVMYIQESQDRLPRHLLAQEL